MLGHEDMRTMAAFYTMVRDESYEKAKETMNANGLKRSIVLQFMPDAQAVS